MLTSLWLFWLTSLFHLSSSLRVLSGHSKRTPKMVFNTEYCLMEVKRIAECSPWSILQYFRPPLSYCFPLRPWFSIFLSGRLRQVTCADPESFVRGDPILTMFFFFFFFF